MEVKWAQLMRTAFFDSTCLIKGQKLKRHLFLTYRSYIALRSEMDRQTSRQTDSKTFRSKDLGTQGESIKRVRK